ncbi:MAG: aminoglycoside phosphotransferase family protein [Actinobacteria bacterium]|nr:aminoglycoside phosphotransferase family protein [Actinomycetota bacterium]
MSLLAQARARHALDASGLDASMPLELANSVTNEVWIGHDVVVRINAKPNDRLRREAALARLLPPEVGYPPIIAYGGEVGADYLILQRVPGHPLGRWWPGMTVDQRRDAITQLARKLEAVHSTSAFGLPPLLHTPQLLTSAHDGRDAVRPLLAAVDELAGMPHVEHRLVDQVRAIIEATAPALTPFDADTLIHGDLTFENILWDGERITALLDFEWARPGPPDLDLDILLRCCAYPQLHVAPDYEDRTRPVDYEQIPWWLSDAYPDLFGAPYVFERVRLYGFAWDVAELLAFPLPAEPRRMAPEHPYHRLRRAVEGTGYLDVLSGDAPGVSAVQ